MFCAKRLAQNASNYFCGNELGKSILENVSHTIFPACNSTSGNCNGAEIFSKSRKHLQKLKCGPVEAEINKTDFDHTTYSRFFANVLRVIWKHCRRLRRSPNEQALAYQECTGTEAQALQRIMNSMKDQLQRSLKFDKFECAYIIIFRKRKRHI